MFRRSRRKWSRRWPRVCAPRWGADVGIAVSGVAGPEPHEGLDPGALWIGIHLNGESEAVNLTLPFDRERIRQFACIMALNMLRTRMLAA